MTHLPAAQFADAMERVAHEGDRVIIERNGQPVAALISVDDLALLEDLEDAADLAAAEQAMAEPGETIPWEKFKADRNL